MRAAFAACLLGLLSVSPSGAAAGASNVAVVAYCAQSAASAIPRRDRGSRTGSSFVKDIMRVSGAARDRAVVEQVRSGNVPDFLRMFIPVTLRGTTSRQEEVDVTVCVAPDYLAVGEDNDFVRVPVGLPAAVSIARELGLFLPTTRMVDAIYAQAGLQLNPAPMPPTAQMESTDYFWRHNATVNEQRAHFHEPMTVLTAGQKKDIVLSNRLRTKPGRVAIYGWHRKNGKPIQPLSTVHHADYADYSHGLRLVSPVAFVNGERRSLAEILQDPDLSQIVSSEGAIPVAGSLLGPRR